MKGIKLTMVLLLALAAPVPVSADVVEDTLDTLARIEVILKQSPSLSVAQRLEIIPLIAISVAEALEKHRLQEQKKYDEYSNMVATWSAYQNELKKNETGGAE